MESYLLSDVFETILNITIFNDSSSVTQASTVHLGWNGEEQIYVPFKDIIPILSPSDLIIDGWDINSANLYEACQRARVSSEYSRKEKA